MITPHIIAYMIIGLFILGMGIAIYFLTNYDGKY